MTQQLTLVHRRIGADQPPLVIAEVGNNHEGSFEKALAMVDAFMQALRHPSFWTAPRQKQFRDLRFAVELAHATVHG